MRSPVIDLTTLRSKYDALPAIEELPGERTYLGRCDTFARFLQFGPDCAAFLRYFEAEGSPIDDYHPELAALLREAWPALPDGSGEIER